MLCDQLNLSSQRWTEEEQPGSDSGFDLYLLKSGKCFIKHSSSDLSLGFKHKNVLRLDC